MIWKLEPTGAEWGFLAVLILWAGFFLYEAWENLVNGRFSRYGPDAWAIWLGNKLGGASTRQRMQRVAGNPSRKIWVGLYALGMGLVAVWRIAAWIRDYAAS